MIIGIDPGLYGGICIGGKIIVDMPIKKILIKDAIYVYKHKDPKIVIKSGFNKGQRQKIIKKAAKYKTELDVKEIYDLLYPYSGDSIYLESLGTTVGNSSKATRSTQINYGKLLAVFDLLNMEVIQITATSWKKYFKLNKNKESSVTLAEKVSGYSFRTTRGTLLDGRAEAYLIWMYGDNK